MMEVQKTCCNQCLFTDNKIVTEKRKRQIVRDCLKEDRHFTCHKASVHGSDVCCRGFWNLFKNNINLGRIAQRLGAVRFVEIK